MNAELVRYHFNQYQDTIARFFPKKNSNDGNTLNTANITFQVTDACNLKCTYCYQINKGHHAMTFDVAKKFIDLLLDDDENTQQYIDSKNSEAAIIEFIGGEPFLQIDLIDKISDYFVAQCILKKHPWAKHHMFSICSNGLLYFDPRVQAYLRKHYGSISLSISIDGNKELHDACRILPDGSGSYDIAMKAVRHYIQNFGNDMGSKMTLCPENIMHTFEAVKSLIESGYKVIHLNCVYEKGWTVEHAKILYSELKKLSDYIIENKLQKIYISMFEDNFFCPKPITDTQNWCGGNGQMISLDWKGDIYPCIRYMESSLGNDCAPIIVGNVDTGIMTTEEQQKLVKLLKSVNRISQSTEECINCPIAEGCSWCQAYNYQDSGGNINHRATYICIMHKARALANAYYWNKLFRLYEPNRRMHLFLPDQDALKIIDLNELQMLKNLELPNN